MKIIELIIKLIIVFTLISCDMLGIIFIIGIFMCKIHSSINHRNYFQTSKGHMTWIILKVNRIPTHCGVAYECVHSFSRGHVIRVCVKSAQIYGLLSL